MVALRAIIPFHFLGGLPVNVVVVLPKINELVGRIILNVFHEAAAEQELALILPRVLALPIRGHAFVRWCEQWFLDSNNTWRSQGVVVARDGPARVMLRRATTLLFVVFMKALQRILVSSEI